MNIRIFLPKIILILVDRSKIKKMERKKEQQKSVVKSSWLRRTPFFGYSQPVLNTPKAKMEQGNRKDRPKFLFWSLCLALAKLILIPTSYSTKMFLNCFSGSLAKTMYQYLASTTLDTLNLHLLQRSLRTITASLSYFCYVNVK